MLALTLRTRMAGTVLASSPYRLSRARFVRRTVHLQARESLGTRLGSVVLRFLIWASFALHLLLTHVRENEAQDPAKVTKFVMRHNAR